MKHKRILRFLRHGMFGVVEVVDLERIALDTILRTLLL